MEDTKKESQEYLDTLRKLIEITKKYQPKADAWFFFCVLPKGSEELDIYQVQLEDGEIVTQDRQQGSYTKRGLKLTLLNGESDVDLLTFRDTFGQTS